MYLEIIFRKDDFGKEEQAMAMLSSNFFSIFNNNNSSSNGIFSGFSLTDYNSIRSGSY
jgi:hypothetical protein